VRKDDAFANGCASRLPAILQLERDFILAHVAITNRVSLIADRRSGSERSTRARRHSVDKEIKPAD
jgi:hypothetical protein